MSSSTCAGKIYHVVNVLRFRNLNIQQLFSSQHIIVLSCADRRPNQLHLCLALSISIVWNVLLWVFIFQHQAPIHYIDWFIHLKILHSFILFQTQFFHYEGYNYSNCFNVDDRGCFGLFGSPSDEYECRSKQDGIIRIVRRSKRCVHTTSFVTRCRTRNTDWSMDGLECCFRKWSQRHRCTSWYVETKESR